MGFDSAQAKHNIGLPFAGYIFTGIEGFSSFPLGFIGKSVRIRQPMDTLIFPRTVPLRREVIESLLGKHGVGARPGRRAGQGGEYFGLREYRSGDSLRSVAWKRVRPDEGLIVMQRSISAPPRALFVLDLRRPTDELRVEEEGEFDPRELEERAISLIGSLAETAMSLGVEFGLRVPGIDLVPLPVRGGRRHMDRLLAHLAAIDLDRPRIESSTRIPVRNQETMVVVHPDRTDPSIGGDGAWHLLPSSLEEFAVNPTDVSAATESEVAA